MLEIEGQRFVTATEVGRGYIGGDVTMAMVAMWRKRRMVTPYRVGREVFYRLDELKEVEQATRDTPRGRPRRKLDQD